MRTGELACSLPGFFFANTSSSAEIFLVTNQYNRDLALPVRLSHLFDEFDKLSCHFKTVMISDRVYHYESFPISYVRSLSLSETKNEKIYIYELLND